MCDIKERPRTLTPQAKEKVKAIDKKLQQIEITSARIKAVNFINMQTFDSVYKNYEQGEVYKVDGIGYTVITEKSLTEILFVIIMHVDSIWSEHFQDVDKTLDIKQGTYYDMFTGKEYIDNVEVKAFEPSYFKAIGKEDLIMKGKIFR